jgi:hypothetical protein
MLLQAVHSKPPTLFTCPRVEGTAGDLFALGCVLYLLVEGCLPYGVESAPTMESLRAAYLSQPFFTSGAYGSIELEGLVRSLLLTPEIVLESLMRGAQQGATSVTLTLDDDVLDSIGAGGGSSSSKRLAPPPPSRGGPTKLSVGSGSGGGGGGLEGESKEAQRLARLARMRSSAAQEGEEEALRLVRVEAHAERVRLKALGAGGGGASAGGPNPTPPPHPHSAPVAERSRPAALSRTPPKGSPASPQSSFERAVRGGGSRGGEDAEGVEEEGLAVEGLLVHGTTPSSSAILQLRAAKLEKRRAEEEAALGAARVAAFQGRLALAAKAKDQYSGSDAPSSLPHSAVSSTASSVISDGSAGGGGGRRDTPSPLVFPPPPPSAPPLSGPSLASQLRAERLRKATEEEEEQLRKARVVAHNERLLLKQKAVGYI